KTVMDLIVELTKRRGMSTILITHDLGLAASYCDRVVVMEKGRVVETAPSREIFTAPSHPYTRKLMRATPRPGVALRDLLPEDDCIATGSGVRGLQTCQEGVTTLPMEEGARRPCSRVELNSPMDPIARARANGEASKTTAPLLVVEKLVKEYPRKGL